MLIILRILKVMLNSMLPLSKLAFPNKPLMFLTHKLNPNKEKPRIPPPRKSFENESLYYSIRHESKITAVIFLISSNSSIIGNFAA